MAALVQSMVNISMLNRETLRWENEGGVEVEVEVEDVVEDKRLDYSMCLFLILILLTCSRYKGSAKCMNHLASYFCKKGTA